MAAPERFAESQIPLRHFAATQQFSRFRSEADIQQPRLQNRIYEYAP